MEPRRSRIMDSSALSQCSLQEPSVLIDTVPTVLDLPVILGSEGQCPSLASGPCWEKLEEKMIPQVAVGSPEPKETHVENSLVWRRHGCYTQERNKNVLPTRKRVN